MSEKSKIVQPGSIWKATGQEFTTTWNTNDLLLVAGAEPHELKRYTNLSNSFTYRKEDYPEHRSIVDRRIALHEQFMVVSFEQMSDNHELVVLLDGGLWYSFMKANRRFKKLFTKVVD